MNKGNHINGSCLCGQVRYEIRAEMGAITHCHCPSCQKAHAAAFSSVSAAPLHGLIFTAGEALLKCYESSPGKMRYFCSHCGSQIYAKRDDQNHYILRMGTIDGDPGIRPSQHIFTSYKAPWYNIHDDIPEYSQWPEQNDTLIKKYYPLIDEARAVLHQAVRRGTSTSLLLLQIIGIQEGSLHTSEGNSSDTAELTRQIKKNVRDSDTIIYLENGMYAVLLPYTGDGAAIILVERIRNSLKAIAQHVNIGAASLHPEQIKHDETDVKQLIHLAEKSLAS